MRDHNGFIFDPFMGKCNLSLEAVHFCTVCVLKTNK
jgi:hypothetical protein